MTVAMGSRSDRRQTAITALLPPSILSANAMWTWWNEPRALYRNRCWFVGCQTNAGDVAILAYNIDTHAVRSFTLHAAFEVEDHDNPCLLFLPDGRLRVFYTLHANPGHSAITRVTSSAVAGIDDILSWGAEAAVPGGDWHPTLTGYTYPKPAMLSAEGNRCYQIFRADDAHQRIMWSDNIAADVPTWTTATILFDTSASGQRPYVHIVTNGIDTIHCVTTNDHPIATNNALYHFKIRGGSIYRSDDTLIGPLSGGVTAATATKIYDPATDGRAWGSDLKLDAAGTLHVAYMTNQSGLEVGANESHSYRAARLPVGGSWRDAVVCSGGGSFHTDPVIAQQPDYTGLIAIDGDIAYASRQKGVEVWGIDRFITADAGVSWQFDAKISEATTKNVRPYVPQGLPADGPRVIWALGNSGAPAGYNGYRNFLNYNMSFVFENRFPVV